MKKLYVQVMVVIVAAILVAALNAWLLLSVNPVEYYFTLRGFLGAGMLDAIECALLIPMAIAFTKEDKVLREKLWVKKES